MTSPEPERETASFRLLSPDRTLTTSRIRQTLPPGALDTLPARVATFFSDRVDGPSILVGAIPFDRTRLDFLHQPDTVARDGERPGSSAWPQAFGSQAWQVEHRPHAQDYGAGVSRALAMMNAEGETSGSLRKVVLARALLATAPDRIDREAVLRHLARDRSITTFQVPMPDGDTTLIGATPELLVSRRGSLVVSHPLAGSMRRHADPVKDREAAARLDRSEKNHREHREVVEAIMDGLAPHCVDICAPHGTTLRATDTMWHLGTRIEGTLRTDEIGVSELLAALHPTPAVCGMPRVAASDAIARIEDEDRGFYAGAVGWIDERGDGEWYVTLRCAEIGGRQALLHAGAGIVPGSDPMAEADETSAKFLTMLTALGIDETGRPVGARAA